MAWMPGCCGDVPSRAELRRRRVTDAARNLFVRNGFHATGMAQIAKASGIAIGQIYRDFSSKEDVVAALVEVDCARLLMFDALHAAIRDGDADAVLAWLREFVEPGESVDDARLFAEIAAESARNDRIAAILHRLQTQLDDHLHAALLLLAPGDEHAARRTDMAAIVKTLSLGLFHHQLMRPAIDLKRLVRALHALLDRELASLRAD